ncbi:MAG TPA: transglutaminase domain-containing protein [Burkholderiales bacterium]|nr:transglutaminase domain-containing protein [Burkholderiales bacterium]
MDRRAFVTSAAAAVLPWRIAFSQSGWRTFEVTTRAEVDFAEGVSRVWLPLPLIDDNEWQRSLGSAWTGNAARADIARDGKYGVAMLYAEWPAGQPAPRIELTSRFSTRDRAVDLGRADPQAKALSAADFSFYTAPTEWIPTDGIVRDTARGIVKGARSDVEKARAIYEWVVENTFRDPKVRGCGWGDIKAMLETGNLGGKCGDLNGLFVGLARSVGVPARDVYGIRVAASAHGYRSLGVGTPMISRAQHCRAEFYAQGAGWVPVDPADVRKVVLEEPPGQLAVGDPKVVAARKRLFGSWEMNWLAYNMGHDIALPQSKGPKLPYLMYPNGETGNERLDQLDPDAFKYSITARELTA